MNQKISIAILSIGSLLYSKVALGQDFSSVYSGNGLAGLVTNQTAITQTAIGKKATVAYQQQNLTKSNNLAALSFKPSMAVRKRNLAQFVSRLRTIDPALAQAFTTTDPMGKIDKGMTMIGLKSNNVADAYTVYWTNAWLGSRGRNEDLPKVQMIAVRNQSANALLSAPQFTAATNAQKQEIAEGLLIQAVLISAIIDNVKSNPAQLADAKAAISQGAKVFGLDLDRMNLTPQGFRPIN